MLIRNQQVVSSILTVGFLFSRLFNSPQPFPTEPLAKRTRDFETGPIFSRRMRPKPARVSPKEEKKMRKTFLIVLALVAGLAIAFNARAIVNPNDVPRMSIDELKQQMGNPNLIIIDVRTPHDWEESKAQIKGAIREEPSEVDSWMSKYPPGKTLLFYCA
jgi:hypothetical protein